MSEQVNSSNANRNPVYQKHLEDITRIGHCPFCPDALHKEHPNPIIDETDHWLLTENAYPYEGSAAHLLVIHREHVETVLDLEKDDFAELLAITGIAVARYRLKGATLLMRFGDTAMNGATVNHLHAQIVSGPGTEGSQPVLARVG